MIHGWVYSLETGLIKDLDISITNESDLPPIFRMIREKTII